MTFATILLTLALAGTGEAPTMLQITANPAITQGYATGPTGQLHYWQAGPAAAPVLLLVHQSSSSAEEYAGLVPYLKDRYRLVAWDWPGHGMSDDPDHELGVAEYSASGLAVLDHLGIDQFHVLGHHGGALVAMNLAWKHPERTDRIILSGTSGVKSAAEAAQFAEDLDLERRKRVDREGRSISEAWGRFIKYMPHSDPRTVLITFLNNLQSRLRPYDAHYGVLRWDRRPALAALVDRDVLLTQGENDEYVSHQETLLERLPKARRSVIPDAGTFLFFENPAACAALIAEFLGP